MTLRRSTRVLTRPVIAVPPVIATTTTTTASTISSRKQSTKALTADSGISKKRRNASPIKDGAKAEFKKPEIPITPIKKLSTPKQNRKAPPLTPTPSFVNILRAQSNLNGNDDITSPSTDRPVEPHITNAPLLTPGGTQHVAYQNGAPDSSPSKTGLPRPTATTGTLLDQACAHLIQVEPRLKPLLERHRCPVFSPEGLAEKIDPFKSLSSGIMAQQVSTAAANSIQKKFVALFNEPAAEGEILDEETLERKFPTPAQVASTSIERLRLAGLSQRKAEYIHGLAEKFVSKELTTDMLMKATDDEVMEKLIAVRGLGKWSVEMFACFGLKRLDILSTGDLAVQRGMARFFNNSLQKPAAKGGGKWKYMSEQDMLDKSAPFAPYRSLFMWLMWRVEDVDVKMLQ